MEIIRDVLDNQLIDRRGRKMGKVDGVVMVVRRGKPPRLAFIEVGASVLARRLGRRLEQLVQRAGRRWGLRRGEPFRIAWSKVRDIGIDVKVELDADETPVLKWEVWLRERVIRRIPGSG